MGCDMDDIKIKIILWVVLAAISAGAGAWASRAYYQPRLSLSDLKADQATNRAQQFETAYTALAAAARRQNTAINDLQAQGEVREVAAKKAVEAAQGAAQKLYAQAAKTSASRPPAASDECTAARQAFDDELKHERGLQ